MSLIKEKLEAPRYAVLKKIPISPCNYVFV